eukprot:GHRQ01027512.1.p3 GENE.GHRQ01027512.1~~GHRQ01027512.1.p3  ORF type:complete len:117 (+),score=20.96 GHRQ01027512.1:203-553(+)
MSAPALHTFKHTTICPVAAKPGAGSTPCTLLLAASVGQYCDALTELGDKFGGWVAPEVLAVGHVVVVVHAAVAGVADPAPAQQVLVVVVNDGALGGAAADKHIRGVDLQVAKAQAA